MEIFFWNKALNDEINKEIRELIDRKMKENMFDFGYALKLLKDGKKVRRSTWNTFTFLYYVNEASYPAMTDIAKNTFGENATVKYHAYIALKNADNTVSIWSPTQDDMLNTDWFEVD